MKKKTVILLMILFLFLILLLVDVIDILGGTSADIIGMPEFTPFHKS